MKENLTLTLTANDGSVRTFKHREINVNAMGAGVIEINTNAEHFEFPYTKENVAAVQAYRDALMGR